jgi:hypothetical protein
MDGTCVVWSRSDLVDVAAVGATGHSEEVGNLRRSRPYRAMCAVARKVCRIRRTRRDKIMSDATNFGKYDWLYVSADTERLDQ